MQRYSMAALQDGLDLPTIKSLASLATWGKHLGNIERDFHRMVPFLYDTKFPLHSMCVEVFDHDKGTIVEVEVPCLLPTDCLAALWAKQSPQLWDIVIGCNAASAKAFWENLKRCSPASFSHPVFEHICGKELSFFPPDALGKRFWFNNKAMLCHSICYVATKVRPRGGDYPSAFASMYIRACVVLLEDL